MAVTIGDCGEAAAAIYKNSDFPGWALYSGRVDPKNKAVAGSAYSVGLYGCYNDGNLFIISVRGSAKDVWTKDWIDDDATIGIGRTPDRYAAALSFTKSVLVANSKAKYIVVGHSLGGHIAQMLGLMCSLPFVTFNAPPALGTWSGTLPNGISPRGFKLGLNYRVNYDPVSKTSGKHIGPLVTLKLGGTSVAGAHGKKGYLHSIQAEGLTYADALGTIGLMNP